MTRTPEQILCCPEGCEIDGACAPLCGDDALDKLLAMPFPDRLTLARALVPDGWVVAKVPPPEKHIRGMDESACGVVIGWNACRAAMLASTEAPNDE